jgi:probable HAF family extracellular repeat protein
VGWSEVAGASVPGAEATPVMSFGMSTPPETPPPHAFVWQDGVMADLNDLAAGAELMLETAFAITDAGQIIGGAFVGDGYHAFLLTPGD